MSKAYLDDLFNLFYPENMKIFSIKKEGQFITGMIALAYKDKILLWMGTPKINVGGAYPNDLLFWEFISWAHNNNYKVLENQWANTQRLCKYKSKFNPRTSIYFSCEKYSPLIKALYSIKNKIKRPQ
jgi:hypothetical protein